MKQKILIIDDDTDLCRLLRNNLEREGYDVCVRHDGVTGLQELQSAGYQLVVLDIIFLARVSALLRRYTVFNKAGMREQRITAGRLSMDQSGREVRKEDRLLDLTAKEFDLLLFFMENPGKVFTKKQIYRAVWNDEYAYDDNNIMVHIRRLKRTDTASSP